MKDDILTIAKKQLEELQAKCNALATFIGMYEELAPKSAKAPPQ